MGRDSRSITMEITSISSLLVEDMAIFQNNWAFFLQKESNKNGP